MSTNAVKAALGGGGVRELRYPVDIAADSPLNLLEGWNAPIPDMQPVGMSHFHDRLVRFVPSWIGTKQMFSPTDNGMPLRDTTYFVWDDYSGYALVLEDTGTGGRMVQCYLFHLCRHDYQCERFGSRTFARSTCSKCGHVYERDSSG